VKKRLVADVPVGAFLSGGLDSSIVAGLMSCFQPTRTFSISFREETFNEIAYAREAAARFKTEHREFEVTADAGRDPAAAGGALRRAVRGRVGRPTYYVSRETSKHVKVALSGDGGDELFLGYRRYEAIARMASLKALAGPAAGGGGDRAEAVADELRRARAADARDVAGAARRPVRRLSQHLHAVDAERRWAWREGGRLRRRPFAPHARGCGGRGGICRPGTYLANDILARWTSPRWRTAWKCAARSSTGTSSTWRCGCPRRCGRERTCCGGPSGTCCRPRS